MIKRQFMGRTPPRTVLTAEIIAHKDVKPCKSRGAHVHRLVLLKRYNTRQREYGVGAPYTNVIRRYYRHPIEKYGLDNVLPRPYGERHVTERGKIGV